MSFHSCHLISCHFIPFMSFIWFNSFMSFLFISFISFHSMWVASWANTTNHHWCNNLASLSNFLTVPIQNFQRRHNASLSPILGVHSQNAATKGFMSLLSTVTSFYHTLLHFILARSFSLSVDCHSRNKLSPVAPCLFLFFEASTVFVHYLLWTVALCVI